jgi:hypothetical protein
VFRINLIQRTHTLYISARCVCDFNMLRTLIINIQSMHCESNVMSIDTDIATFSFAVDNVTQYRWDATDAARERLYSRENSALSRQHALLFTLRSRPALRSRLSKKSGFPAPVKPLELYTLQDEETFHDIHDELRNVTNLVPDDMAAVLHTHFDALVSAREQMASARLWYKLCIARLLRDLERYTDYEIVCGTSVLSTITTLNTRK